jgi:hypothetical protein
LTSEHPAIKEFEDGWILPVDGRQVTRCCVDYAAIGLLLDNGLHISIEDIFTYASPDGIEYELDPDGEAGNLAPILHLRRASADRGLAFNDGHLEVYFNDGSYIHVAASQHFESWGITGPGGLRVVSMPGGDLAIWKGDGGQ